MITVENEPLTSDALETLRTHFPALPEKTIFLDGSEITLEQVRQFLIEQISVLLDRNPALLMSILYRIDVAERDVMQALTASPPEAIPGKLAELMLARQLQKQAIRRAYKDGDP